MKPVTYTQVRQNPKLVVMISLEDYNAIEETLYLMRSPKNYARLMSSVEHLRQHGGKPRELIEKDDDSI